MDSINKDVVALKTQRQSFTSRKLRYVPETQMSFGF